MMSCVLTLTLIVTLGFAANASTRFHPRLLRVRLSASEVKQGDIIQLDTWWENTGSVSADENDMVFVHARIKGMQEDNRAYPLFGGDYSPAPPTSLWESGYVMRMHSQLKIPQNARAGDYQILIGIYSQLTGERVILDNLSANQGNESYLAGNFKVMPKEEKTTKQSAIIDLALFPLTASFFTPPSLTIPASGTVTLSNKTISVKLDKNKPAILSFEGENGGKLYGDAFDQGPSFFLCQEKTGENRWSIAKPLHVTFALSKIQKEDARYTVIIHWGDVEAAHCDIFYHLKGNELTVGFGNVVEKSGYQLLTFRMPELVSVLRSQHGSRMAIPWESGRLISLSNTFNGEMEHHSDWLNPMLAGLVYTHRILAGMQLETPDDILRSHLWDYNSNAVAGLGVDFTHRYAAAHPSLQFVAETHSQVHILIKESTHKRVLTWVDGAKLLRQRMTAIPPGRYRDCLIYKIFCDTPGDGNPTTFDEALNLVKEIYFLTDGLKQIVYLVGWQHHGHDTGYPDVFTVNARLGGYSELVKVMDSAKKYNAVISFHDNYDDAYEDSHAWTPDIIARGPDGELMKGGIWAGGQSYIISSGWYLHHGALKRIRRTLAMYPIRESYHIDVLSTVPDRVDFNPSHPQSAKDDLEGRLGIVLAFQQDGVNVTSEGFTSWFVGHVGYFWLLLHDDTHAYAGDEAIPFIPFVFHGRALYALGWPNNDSQYLEEVLYGGNFSTDLRKETPLKQILDRIYLINAPWRMLAYRQMEKCERKGDIIRISYGPNITESDEKPKSIGPTFVEVNSSTNEYCVVVDGRLISQNFSVFVPGEKSNTWVAYSRCERELVYPTPKGWKGSSIVRGVCLTAHGTGERVSCWISKGEIHLKAPAGQPVRVFMKTNQK